MCRGHRPRCVQAAGGRLTVFLPISKERTVSAVVWLLIRRWQVGLLLWAWPTQSVPHTKAINPHPTASWSIAQSSKASRTPTPVPKGDWLALFDVSTRHAMRREGCWPAAALQLPQAEDGRTSCWYVRSVQPAFAYSGDSVLASKIGRTVT